MEERERERDICGGSWWKCVEIGGILEKKLWLVEEGKELKKKEKGKEIKREDIFLDSKVKLLKRLIPGFESWMRKTFRKIPKSSRNQVSRNDSQNLPKIKNNILRLMVKFV